MQDIQKTKSLSSVFFHLIVFAGICLVFAACGSTNSGQGDSESGSGEEDASRDGKASAASGDPTSGMSVQEMVGQMFVVSLQGTESDYYIEKMIEERNIGGAILFGYNMESEEQVRALTDSMQKLSMQTEPAIPMMVAVDHEGGEIAGAPWVTPQPSAAEVGATGDPSQARTIARDIGTQLMAAGVNTDFAPVVDTGAGAAIGTRSYGDDPALVSRMGVASARGFEKAGVIHSVKHFPNHGPAESDSHTSLPTIDHDMQTIEDYDLPPFRAAIDSGVPMVMVGHLVYPEIDPDNPASLSPAAYSMLREDLGFDGVTITDDLAMEGANGGNPPADAAVSAVAAGADMLILSNVPQEQADAYDAVVAAVESGEIPEEQVRQSVNRILNIKNEFGLYDRG